ncbi:cardiolipin synthase B [Hydrocarboniclastica marina]|uniref:Cardiolipin synthase B n=2 Tax=Hydrocarboniclastica marina TaxID=2259620 RepID=A0A4P7XL17_9ALTE|nr:cardiolipin synthase B [Hydrocarboniclastica marina]
MGKGARSPFSCLRRPASNGRGRSSRHRPAPHHRRVMLFTLSLMTAVFVATAIYFVVSRRRSLPAINLHLERIPPIEHGLRQLAGLTGGALYEGNKAQVYQDGDLLDALYDAIENARSTVHLESYVWNRGRTEREFVELLCRKSEEGVVVRVLVDTVGAMNASGQQLNLLRESGVSVGFYHRIIRFNIHRLNNRTHRKLLIVDGKVGFTFGHGIRDEWRGHGQDEQHWRDTGVQLEGPVVCPLQALFAEDWIEATGSPPLDEGCFLEPRQQGTVTSHVVSSSTAGGHSSVALLYMLAIASARHEIIIQNPYFVPAPALPDLLEKMVARGVKVRVMIPDRHSDSPIVRRAGQRLYQRLLRAGIDFYLYEKTFLHQKIVIIDGVWSHIGSTNLDARSLALNTEAGVGLMDKDIAAQLKEAFERDLQHCRKLTLEQWSKRPRRQRVLDWCAYQLKGQI